MGPSPLTSRLVPALVAIRRTVVFYGVEARRPSKKNNMVCPAGLSSYRLWTCGYPLSSRFIRCRRYALTARRDWLDCPAGLSANAGECGWAGAHSIPRSPPFFPYYCLRSVGLSHDCPERQSASVKPTCSRASANSILHHQSVVLAQVLRLLVGRHARCKEPRVYCASEVPRSPCRASAYAGQTRLGRSPFHSSTAPASEPSRSVLAMEQTTCPAGLSVYAGQIWLRRSPFHSSITPVSEKCLQSVDSRE